ncbi:hypothetical protein Tcan_05046 [Toxocara canis]|uniref:Uncharacterized protein n=1 Tax=Toxocara canis TaxID=6265 RepID=A0A0B2V1Z8_TOXCA|nr:hypothetical protein Tcan_05046 [Toxocara canis]
MTFIHSWFFVPDQGDTVYHFCDPGMYDIHFAKVADIVLLVLQVVAVLTFVGLWHRNKRLTILLMPVVTSAFIFCIPLLSAHIRRSLFRLTGLRHCFQDSSNRIDSVEQAATRIYFEMLEKQWEESFKRERRRLPARSQNYFAGAT